MRFWNVFLLLLVSVSGRAAAVVLKTERSKNVLFLAVDDLRPQLDCTDMPGTIRPHMYTPNLCRLANESLVLLRSQVAMATCSPSRTAFLTGRHVGRTHVWDLYSYFRNVTEGNFTTIPQYFKERGYVTQGAGKIFHPGSASGGGSCSVCRGSDDATYSWSEPYFHGTNPIDENYEASWMAVDENQTGPLQDSQVRDFAVDWLRNRSDASRRPFFLAVGFHKPHLPFVFPSRFMNDHYPEDEIRIPPNNFAPYGMPDIAWQSYGETRSYDDIAKLNATGAVNTSLPNRTIRELRRAYYSAVSYTDDNVGAVLNALRDTGLESTTVVVFLGDHGWQLGEHGLWDKHTNFQLATHAPVFFKVPGLTSDGIRTFQVTETVDVFPSIVDFALNEVVPTCASSSLPLKTCTDGVSLRPLIARPDKPIRGTALSVYSRHVPSSSHRHGRSLSNMSPCLSGGNKGCALGYSILTYLDKHEVRYTEWVHFPGPSNRFRPVWTTNYGVEFYNHTESPSEDINRNAWLSSSVRSELSRRLRMRVDETSSYYADVSAVPTD